MEKKEYIERGAILRKSETMFDGQKYCTAVNTGFIYTAPTADVVEVVRGEWVFKRTFYDADECNCSLCGQLMTTAHGVRMNYCPHCGAKMDGKTYTLAEVKTELGLDQMDGWKHETD